MKEIFFYNRALTPICIWALITFGCSNSSTIFRYDDTENDSLFVQRDFGAKVFITMNNDEEYTGELLRVRDGTMLLCKKYEASEEKLSDLVYPFYSLQNKDIKQIELKGENHLIGGIVFGGLAGLIVTGIIVLVHAISRQFSSNGGEGIVILIGGGIGILAGGITGASNTTYDEVVYESVNPEKYDFTRLNIYSRYGGEEPDYLKEMK